MQQSSVAGRTNSWPGQGYCELQQLRCLERHAATRIRGDGAVASYAQAHEAAIPDIVTMWWNCHFNHHLLRYMVLPDAHLLLTMPSYVSAVALGGQHTSASAVHMRIGGKASNCSYCLGSGDAALPRRWASESNNDVAN